jgi:hypothetical protein
MFDQQQKVLVFDLFSLFAQKTPKGESQLNHEELKNRTTIQIDSKGSKACTGERGGDDFQLPAAVGAMFDVDIKYPF